MHKVGRIAFGLHLSISLETGPNFDLPSFSNLITVLISLIVILESSGSSFPCVYFFKSYKVCLTLCLLSLVFWLFKNFWKQGFHVFGWMQFALLFILSLSDVSVNSNWVHPPGQPQGKFFWASESRPHGQIFLSNSLPRSQNDGRIPGGGAKFFSKLKRLLLKLAKNP